MRLDFFFLLWGFLSLLPASDMIWSKISSDTIHHFTDSTYNLNFVTFGSIDIHLLILPDKNVDFVVSEYYNLEMRTFICYGYHKTWQGHLRTSFLLCHLSCVLLLLPSFFHLCVCVVYMLVCMHAPMWWGAHACVQVTWRLGSEYFSTALHLSLWVRASQLIPDHVNIPSWASLFAPDSVASVSAVLKLQAGHHTYLAYIQVLDIWTLLSCWCGKCLFSWAVSPSPHPPLSTFLSSSGLYLSWLICHFSFPTWPSFWRPQAPVTIMSGPTSSHPCMFVIVQKSPIQINVKRQCRTTVCFSALTYNLRGGRRL